MSENGVELVRRLHHEAVEQRRAHEAHKRALVQSMFEQAAARQREEQQALQASVVEGHQQALARRRDEAPAVPAQQMVHFSELPEAQPNSPLRCEWDTYRREVARLLAEGRAGRHVLIKGTDILGLWATSSEAMAAGYRGFPGQPFLVREVREYEPVLRCLSVRSCPNTPIRCRKAS